MELTAKAAKEVAKYQERIALLARESEKLQERMHPKDGSRVDFIVYKALQSERNKVYNKQYNAEQKMEAIQKWGVSSSEKGALLRERHSFTCIESDRSLGSRDGIYIGQSKALGGKFVKIRVTHWSGFMSNVRGCGSLANTSDLNSFEVITEEEFNVLKSSDRKFTTSFCGTETRVVKADGATVVASK